MKKILGLLLVFCMLFAVCPATYAAEYAYEINDVYFTDLAGRKLENPTTSCMVNVEVTKNNERIGNELVAIATYSTDGAMIHMTTVSGTMHKGEKELFSTLVWSPLGKNIGMVRTFIWNNISEMRVMSKVFAKEVNKMDEGVELPDISEPPVTGTYIPSTVTVEGMIVGTSLSAGLENGEYEVEIYPVELDLDDVYTEEEYNARVNRTEAICAHYDLPFAYYGYEDPLYTYVYSEIDLTDYLYCEGLFEICMTNDEYVVLAFEPKETKNVTYVQADDYVLQSNLRGDNMYIYSQKLKFGDTFYKMEEGFDIYVNGVAYKENIKTTSMDIETILDTLFGSAQGTIKLIKKDDAQYYTTVFVDYYEVAKVTAVSHSGDETIISMATKNPMDVSYDEIIITDEYVEEGKVNVSVTRNGAEADLASIVKGDIIAYATDFGNNSWKTIEDPVSIKILATNETASGKVTSVDEDNETHTIDGKEYKSVVFNRNFPEIRNSYILTLDPFGRIFEATLSGTSEKYAILVKNTTTGVQLVLADGTTATYELSAKAEMILEDAADYAGETVTTFVNNLAIEDRIIAYTVRNSSNEITALEFVTDATSLNFAEYKARTGKLGSATISSTTQVIDARDAASEGSNRAYNYGAFAVDKFKDGVTYSGYAVTVGTITSFVVITNSSETFPEENKLAIVKAAATAGDDYDKIVVIYGGEETEFDIEQNLYASSGLGVGDVFMFSKNTDDAIDEVYIIRDRSAGTYKTLPEAGVPADMLPYGADGWSYNLWDEGYKMRLVEGYVIDVEGSYLTMASTGINGGSLDKDADIEYNPNGVATLAFAENYGVSKYNINSKTASAAKNHGEIVSANIETFRQEDGTYDFSTAGDISEYLTYAVAIIEDDQIVDIVAYNRGAVNFSTHSITGDVTPVGEYRTSTYMALFDREYEKSRKVYFGNIGYPMTSTAKIYVNDVAIDETISGEVLDKYLMANYEILLKATAGKTAYEAIYLTGTSEKYAILVKKTTTGVQMVLADGTTAIYELSDRAEAYLEDAAADAGETVATFVNYLDIEDRIIAYTVRSSSNEITSLEFVTDATSLDFAEYKARTGKLGSATISSITQVIDATYAASEGLNKASNYGAFAAENFKDGVTYAGYAVTVGTYTNFVVITAVGTKFNEEVRFAVVRKAAAETFTDDGDEVDSVLVLYNGAEEELLFEPYVYDMASLRVGDAFFFDTNRYGFVDKAYTIYKSGANKIITLQEAGVASTDIPADNRGWSYNLWNEGKDIQLVAGYVVDVTSSSITLTTKTAVDAGYVDTALDIDDTEGRTKGVAIFGIDPECVAYEYDTDEDIIKEIDRFSAFDAASTKASAFGRFEHPEDPYILVESYMDEYGDVIELGDMNDYANFAVAMIVDGDVVAIYTIVK